MEKAPKPTRILLVDDEPESIELYQDVLATEGYATETAGSGPEALGRARRNPPDLILLDVRMPDMDGFEVCRHLKADARTAHVPVLIVTGLGSLQEKEQGMAAGADDYVTKPVDPTDLLTRVRAMLRVSHLSQELDRVLAYLQELEAARRSADPARTGFMPMAGEHSEGAEGAVAPDGTRPRVLIVDDEQFIRRLYGTILGGAGYRVITAASAAEAYAAAARGVDVILLDLMMPEVSGLEALERLRKLAPDVPIIIITAYQTVQNAIAALRGGAFDFIVKGMNSEKLLNGVARALERRRLALENRRLMEELRARLDTASSPPRKD